MNNFSVSTVVSLLPLILAVVAGFLVYRRLQGVPLSVLAGIVADIVLSILYRAMIPSAGVSAMGGVSAQAAGAGAIATGLVYLGMAISFLATAIQWVASFLSMVAGKM